MGTRFSPLAGSCGKRRIYRKGDNMYSLEVRLNYELIFRYDTLELQEIIEEVVAWANDPRGNYEITIRQLPRMIVEDNE